jgi:hypothetical protein
MVLLRILEAMSDVWYVFIVTQGISPGGFRLAKATEPGGLSLRSTIVRRSVLLRVPDDHPQSWRHVPQGFPFSNLANPVDVVSLVGSQWLKGAVRSLIVKGRLPVERHVVFHFGSSYTKQQGGARMSNLPAFASSRLTAIRRSKVFVRDRLFQTGGPNDTVNMASRLPRGSNGVKSGVDQIGMSTRGTTDR